MKKILLLLFAIILFISCNSPVKNINTKLNLPENTIHLKLNPKPFIPTLPNELSENSGLIYYDGLLWTMNDSGGKHSIYGFDFTGKAKKKIEIKDAKNVDWEDIAQDDNYIYIGDFGNNYGVRKDLKVYRIKKKDIGKDSKQKVESKKIEFSYKNQKKFNSQHLITPFDCEAFAELNNTLYLFSKNWGKRTTEVYKVPAKKGKYKISPIDSLNVNGLITGADFSPDRKKLALVGYKNFKPIIWIFTDIKPDSLFRGKRTFIEMDSIFNAQTEGICFIGNDSLLISCEESSDFDPQVFLFDFKSIQNNGTHPGK